MTTHPNFVSREAKRPCLAVRRVFHRNYMRAWRAKRRTKQTGAQTQRDALRSLLLRYATIPVS